MKTVLIVIACIAGAVGVFLLGRASAQERDSEVSTVTRVDTVWTTVHDTAVVSATQTRTAVRVDTVWLRAVDTLVVCDTVQVEIPFHDYHFTGDHWAVDAQGWGVTLNGVYIDYPTVMTDRTVTRMRYKRWAFSVGAQVGYGYTARGASPYVGVGVGFGYIF